jgi:hypothetical protein
MLIPNNLVSEFQFYFLSGNNLGLSEGYDNQTYRASQETVWLEMRQFPHFLLIRWRACRSGMQLSPLLESEDGTEEQNGHSRLKERHVRDANCFFFVGRKRGCT